MSRLVARLRGLLRSTATRSAFAARRGACARRRSARRAVWWFVAGAALLHAASFLAMDVVWPRLRDPEYGRRAERLRARVAEQPDRPLVVVVGSSRTAMGVRPGAWEAARPGARRDPLLFNVSVIGAGPIQELITVHRVFADGFRPAVVLIEYWPMFLRQDHPYAEWSRIEPRRLRFDDLPVARGYFPDPGAVERRMRSARWNPLTENGYQWLAQTAPEWLPPHARIDGTWRDLDRWGWRPGPEASPKERPEVMRQLAVNLSPWLAGHTIHPASDRALRQAVAVARANGARVGFVRMPESDAFRRACPPEYTSAALAHVRALSAELGAPVIDARLWSADEEIGDGLHLTPAGATAFTVRLGAAVTVTFPDLKGAR